MTALATRTINGWGEDVTRKRIETANTNNYIHCHYLRWGEDVTRKRIETKRNGKLNFGVHGWGEDVTRKRIETQRKRCGLRRFLLVGRGCDAKAD